MLLTPPMTNMTARYRVRDLALLVACGAKPLQSSRALSSDEP